MARILAVMLVAMATWYTNAESASILMSGMFGEGSHFLCLVPIGESLVRQGHNVTFLISEEYSYRAEDPNLSKLFRFEMFSSKNFSTGVYLRELQRLGFTGSGDLATFFRIFSSYNEVLKKTCMSVLSDQTMMKRFENLDIIVADLGWPCGVAIKFYLQKYANARNIRYVGTVPTIPHILLFDVAGSPYNAAYMPSYMSGLSSPMGFLERIHNLLSVMAMRTFINQIGAGFEEVFEQFNLPQDQPIDARFVANITDLVLANLDFSVEFPFPTTPNIIPVGGLTARPAQPVPSDLNEFLQSSGKHGVIIFTLGTYFSGFMSSRPGVVQDFFEAFRRLPQKVVMQLKEVPDGLDLPSNVRIMNWLPQNDILGHPNTRLFMFHGGNNGFYEGIYHAVPMIIIPFMGDQVDAAVRLESQGIGLRMHKDLLKADIIYETLSKVLSNSTFTKNVKRLSAILRDRPMTAADRAAFWINHVIQFGGQYMKTPFHKLTFIQYYLIDVITFITLVLIVVVYLAYRIAKCSFSCCFISRLKEKRD